MSFPQTPLTLDSTGGIKEDAIPPANHRTDWAAADLNVTRQAACMMTNTCLQAWVSADGYGSLLDQSSLWINNFGNAAPEVSVDGYAVYTVTFPQTIEDELGTSHSVVLKGGWGQPLSNFTTRDVKVEISNAYTAKVYVHDYLGTLYDDTDWQIFLV